MASCGINNAIYIVDPEPTKGSAGVDSPSVDCITWRRQEPCEEQEEKARS